MSIVGRGLGKGSAFGAGYGSYVVWGYGSRLVLAFQEVCTFVLCIVRRKEWTLER